MRALNIPSRGDQPRLSELPVPEVGEGTVLIRVRAAALNAVDNGIAAGMMADAVSHAYPLVLGRDAAGVVEAVGAGVDHVTAGDEVIAHILLAPPVQAGTLAEYALAPATAVTPKPAELDFTAAAALPLAGAAAADAVDRINPQPGQTVLVNGASGGVGSYAVQLLAARGATVLATGTAADTDRLTRLGATQVIDFTTGSVADQVRADYPDGVDGLINLVGYTAADVPLAAVRAGGVVASTTGAPDDDTLNANGLTGGSFLAAPVRQVIQTLAELAASGALTIDVETVLPLDQATEGLALLASGQARGKIVVNIG